MSTDKGQKDFDSYFTAILACFDRAAALTQNAISHTFKIADSSIQVEFAGDALVPKICPAFGHLRAANGLEPSFTIKCFDKNSSGIAIPPRPWPDSDSFIHGEIGSFIDTDHYLHFNLMSGAIIAANRRERIAVFHVRFAEDINTYEMAAPFRDFFNWWGSIRGIYQVHAGALADGAAGALIIGRSGAGKSNTALACLSSTLSYLSDDCCLLDTQDQPYVHSLYSSTKVYNSDIPRYPIFNKYIEEGIRTPEDKRLFFLDRIAPQRLTIGFVPKVIMAVRVTQKEDTTFTPMSPADTLLTMAPDNILRWPVVGRTALSHLARFVRRLPSYYLNVGLNREKIPLAIIEAIRKS